MIDGVVGGSLVQLWSNKGKVLLQFVGFTGVGAIGTGVHYALLVTLVNFGSVDPIIGSGIGFTCGALVNYILNYKFVFHKW